MNSESHHSKISALVARLVHEYGGGELYFDNLDAALRSGEESNLCLVQRLLDACADVVCSGRFGRFIRDMVYAGRLQVHGSLLVVSGGLRKSEHVELEHISGEPSGAYTFVDDSYYSGTTHERVRAFVELRGASVSGVRVIYDGSPVQIAGVTSLYRYYDNLNNKTKTR